MIAYRIAVVWVAGITLATAAPAQAIGTVGVEQRLNASIPRGLSFRDEQNQPVHLDDYLGERPVILAPVYYRCRKLCSLTLNGLAENFRGRSAPADPNFRVVAVSIDPRETPEVAAWKKSELLQRYPDTDIEGSWHFLTGNQPEIEKLTAPVGFRYEYDPVLNQYRHPPGVILLTRSGRIAGYYFGPRFPPFDLESGPKEVGALSRVEQLLLLCSGDKGLAGPYSPRIMGILRFAGVSGTLALASFLALAVVRERRRRPTSRSRGWGDGTPPS